MFKNDSDKKFTEYIQDKRICFVGACPNIVGMNKGVVIDGYDVVVKTGGSVFLQSPEYFRDYGKRLDVLCVNAQFAREMKPLPFDAMKQRGTKWLCMKVVSEENMKKFSQFVNIKCMSDGMKEATKQLKSATYGLGIFLELIKCKPKELYITGIDFFASKKAKFEYDNYQEYLPGYLPDKIREQGNRININKTEDGHNFIGNAKFLFTLFQQYNIIKTDNFIMQLLKDIIAGKVVQK